MVQQGIIQPVIPYPAVGKKVHMYPEDVLPWHPQPMEGDFTTNTRLQAIRLFEGEMDGSESVIVSPDGRAMMLNKFGGVFEAFETPDGRFELNRTAKAWLGPGRPLGAAFDAHGNIIICDALKGILMLEKDTNQVVILTNHVSSSSPLEPGSPILYANDLDVAKDGTVYFTTSVDITLHRNAQHHTRFTHVPSLLGRPGFWDTVKGWGLGMCQALPRGKLYRYDPVTKETHLIATGFYYSNGVAVSKDDDFLVISETDRLRLVKFWLKGAKAGQMEVMIDHMPGTPDGMARAPDGNFWFPLLAKIPPVTKIFHWPIIRMLLPVVPEMWRPQVHEWGAVVKVSPEGDVLEFLEDPQRASFDEWPSSYRISSAHEHAGRLWLGALVANFVSYVDLTNLAPKPEPLPMTWRPPVGCVTPPCDGAQRRFFRKSEQ
uniref:SMP-30/Gluconolactonase/LRE-like region domain-containing protein n=1 Tax=Tetradesmus obliquus TaxID=3088 RepID=A0A383VRX2_TETOB|eukprot:jgi/Sobl393_1/4525/SZX67921.1